MLAGGYALKSYDFRTWHCVVHVTQGKRRGSEPRTQSKVYQTRNIGSRETKVSFRHHANHAGLPLFHDRSIRISNVPDNSLLNQRNAQTMYQSSCSTPFAPENEDLASRASIRSTPIMPSGSCVTEISATCLPCRGQSKFSTAARPS